MFQQLKSYVVSKLEFLIILALESKLNLKQQEFMEKIYYINFNKMRTIDPGLITDSMKTISISLERRF